MSDIVKFEFEGHRVRVVEGREEWIAKDVCEILELQGHTPWEELDADEKGRITYREPDAGNSGVGAIPRTYVTVTESGLYALIFKSRKPAAKRFRKWVTSEVLPSIRKKGGYVEPGREAEFMAVLVQQGKLINQLMATSIVQSEQIIQNTQQIAKLSERLADLENPTGLVKACQAKLIRDTINNLAALENRGKQLSGLVSFNSVNKRLRNRMKPAYPIGSWRTLPARRFDEAMSELAVMTEELRNRQKSIEKEAKRRDEKQGNLFSKN